MYVFCCVITLQSKEWQRLWGFLLHGLSGKNWRGKLWSTNIWSQLYLSLQIFSYQFALIPLELLILLHVTTLVFPYYPIYFPLLIFSSYIGFSWFFSAAASGSGSVQGQRCRNIRDLEPGRCKRTDGKKWRCSRDVAPHQKYCERHMHRGRPRSRKHVEVHAPVNNNNDNKKTRNHPVPLESTPIAVPKPPPTGQTDSRSTQPLRSAFQYMEGPLFLHDKMGQNIFTDPSSNELLHRFLSLLLLFHS